MQFLSMMWEIFKLVKVLGIYMINSFILGEWNRLYLLNIYYDCQIKITFVQLKFDFYILLNSTAYAFFDTWEVSIWTGVRLSLVLNHCFVSLSLISQIKWPWETIPLESVPWYSIIATASYPDTLPPASLLINRWLKYLRIYCLPDVYIICWYYLILIQFIPVQCLNCSV